MNSPDLPSGQVSVFVLLGLVVIAVPTIFSVAYGGAVSSTATQAQPTPPAVLNLTDTPAGTATATGTATETQGSLLGGTATATPPGEGELHVVDDDAVLPTADCPDAAYRRIQHAVNNASSGDTVKVCAGTYRERVRVNTSNLSLRATGNATIDAGAGDAMTVTASNVTVRDFTLRSTNRSGVLVDTASHVRILNNTVVDYRESDNLGGEEHTLHFNDGIRLFKTDRSVVRNNRVFGFDDDQISVGERKVPPGDFKYSVPIENVSTFNRIVGNNVSSVPGYARCGIVASRKAARTVIRNNTATDIRSPTSVLIGGRQLGIGLCNFGNHTNITGNTVQRNVIGIFDVAFHTEILRNTVVNHSSYSVGIFEGGARVIGNQLRVSTFAGVQIGFNGADHADKIEIHRNVIANNQWFGINNGNETVVVDATNNVWACGGPSSGLEDPYTGRVANGSGDEISAGDEPGVSNVHFDPFRTMAVCPADSGSEPTESSAPTSTATVSSTATSTLTPTPTPTQPPQPAVGTGTGGPARRGDDDGASPGTNTTGTVEGGGVGTVTATPPTPTVTPTLPPTPTLTPEPRVEPGFSVLTSVVGLLVLLGLVVGRLRGADVGEDRND